MSFANFIPNVWNETINRDLEKSLVFAEDCNREYEGNVSERGQTVKILGVGKPTIKTLSERNSILDKAEIIEDASINMPINQMSYFRYIVNDVDKAQAVRGLKGALNAEVTEALAEEVDRYIASFATKKEANSMFKVPETIMSTNILQRIDDCLGFLYERDVKNSTKIVMTVTPKFYLLLKQAYVDLDTNNSKMLKNGRVGMYGNVVVKMSNNVAKTTSGSDTVDNIMIRTQRAIAYSNPITSTEVIRSNEQFGDEVRGFILYDAKIVRPNEMVIMNVKY